MYNDKGEGPIITLPDKGKKNVNDIQKDLFTNYFEAALEYLVNTLKQHKYLRKILETKSSWNNVDHLQGDLQQPFFYNTEDTNYEKTWMVFNDFNELYKERAKKEVEYFEKIENEMDRKLYEERAKK